VFVGLFPHCTHITTK